MASVLTSATATSYDKREAIFTLRDGGNTETKAALRLLLRGPDPTLVANAVAALIFGGDLSVLPIAERLLAEPATGMMREGFVNMLGAALDDSDLDVRFGAAVALAEITGLGWTPDMTEFCSDPERYVTRWKEWLRTR